MPNAQPPVVSVPPARKPRMCKQCKLPGHDGRNCPQLSRGLNPSRSNAAASSSSSSSSSSQNRPQAVFANVEVDFAPSDDNDTDSDSSDDDEEMSDEQRENLDPFYLNRMENNLRKIIYGNKLRTSRKTLKHEFFNFFLSF